MVRRQEQLLRGLLLLFGVWRTITPAVSFG
jgi:hypothetical protein